MKPIIPTLLATLALTGAVLAQEAAPEPEAEAPATEAAPAAEGEAAPDAAAEPAEAEATEATATAEAEATPPASADAPPGTAQEMPMTQTITDIITDAPDAATVDADAGALTDPANPEFLSAGDQIGFTTGEGIYQYFCRGCHQYDGKGASGAGAYPALAGNENLEFPDYAVTLIVNGQKGMPPFGGMLSDEQVVEVVKYIQTSFGNSYTEHPTVETVTSVRPEGQAATEGGTGGN